MKEKSSFGVAGYGGHLKSEKNVECDVRTDHVSQPEPSV
jgi:hypothetical protein